MRPRPPVNGDLFGAPPPKRRDHSPVTLPLRVFGETDKAWLLSADGRSGGAKWAPKSEVRRGEGVDEHRFTMPRWVAVERGWL